MITRRAAMPALIAVLLSACGVSVSTSEPTSDAVQTGSPAASTLAHGAGASSRILLLRYPEPGPAEYFVVNADGSDEQPFGLRVEYEGRQVSPDETLLAVVGPNVQGKIVGGTIAVDGSGFQLFENPDPSLNLACGIWAPDDRMACEAWNDAEPSVAGIRTVLAADGSDPQRLTTGRDAPCDYSPDGSQLAFVRQSPEGDAGTLMVLPSEGGEPVALLENVAGSGLPCDWSPDGSSILTATVDGKLQLVTTDGDSATFIAEGLDCLLYTSDAADE